MKGFFQLRTPADLLAKLRHDRGRIQRNRLSAYAAFDFFVTARHLPEWLYHGDDEKRRRLFDDNTLLRVCRHVADGAKHFQPTAKQHDSVQRTSLEDSAFQPGAFQTDAFQVGQLVIELDGDAAVKLGSPIKVTELADRILRFYEELLSTHPQGGHNS